MTTLISDASDVIRFDQGAQLQTVDAPVQLKALLRGVADDAKSLAKKNVRVAVEVGAGPAVVSLDATVLRRALGQLMCNAATATAEGGSITLRVRHAGHSQHAAGLGTKVRFALHLVLTNTHAHS